MDEERRPPRPDLSSDAALDALLRRLGPLMAWQEDEEAGVREDSRPDPAFEHRLRAHLVTGDEPRRRWTERSRGVALRLGLVVVAVAVMILVAVAVVEVGVVTALTTALALVMLAVALFIRARLGH